MFEFITVRELYELYINDRNQLDGIEYVELQGWIRNNLLFFQTYGKAEGTKGKYPQSPA